MTKALEDVFREAEKLPEAEQEQLAAAIRAELEAEPIWEDRLAASPKALEALADDGSIYVLHARRLTERERRRYRRHRR